AEHQRPVSTGGVRDSLPVLARHGRVTPERSGAMGPPQVSVQEGGAKPPGLVLMPSIDLNCDLGESFGRWSLGHDAEVMRSITSANVACGFHAGDPDLMPPPG